MSLKNLSNHSEAIKMLFDEAMRDWDDIDAYQHFLSRRDKRHRLPHREELRCIIEQIRAEDFISKTLSDKNLLRGLFKRRPKFTGATYRVGELK